jgi:hypothetical protein
LPYPDYISSKLVGALPALIALALLATALRLDLNPEPYYFDDRIPLDVIQFMEDSKTLDTNWGQVAHQWYLPGYNNQYNFSSYISFLFYLKQGVNLFEGNVEPLVLYRLTSLFCQLISMLILLVIAIRWFCPLVGISAIALFATSPMFIIDSHYARPESFLILLTSAGLYFTLLAIETRKTPAVFVAGFLCGMLIGSKLSLIPMAGLCLITIMYFFGRYWQVLFLFLLASFVGLFCFAPYMVLNISGVIEGLQFLLNQYFSGSPGGKGQGITEFLLIPYLFFFIGPLTWLIIVAGSLQIFSRHENTGGSWARMFIVICSLLIGFYVVFFSITPFFNESNLTHLAPFLSLVFGLCFTALVNVLNHIFSVQKLQLVTACILGASLTFPLYASFCIVTIVYHKHSGWYDKVNQLEQSLVAEEGRVLVEGNNLTQQLGSILSGSAPKNILIKLPWIDRPAYHGAVDKLEALGYAEVGRVTSPLSFLPHSQIEALHLPRQYRYFVSDP